jgi:hypothetical protein
MTRARYQIAVDGQPRSNRDGKAIAIEAAEYLKHALAEREMSERRPGMGDDKGQADKGGQRR